MNSEQMLTSILHTVQMGQSGIESVMGSAVRAELKKELRSQRKEYDSIEHETARLAQARGWQLHPIHPGILKMADMMSHARLLGGERDSKIAGMLIQGNTRGRIQALKNLHKSKNADPAVTALTQKLLDTQASNISNAQQYL